MATLETAELTTTEDNFYTPQVWEDNPKIVEHEFRGRILQCYDVPIEGEDYEVCEYYSHRRWSNKKSGRYGGGVLNQKDPKDSRRTERTGLLGEMAYSKIMYKPVDLNYRKYGDEQDCVHDDKWLPKILTEDTKCSYTSLGAMLVTATNKNGGLIEHKCDLYVASYLRLEDRDENTATVRLLGFATGDEVRAKPLVKSRLSDGDWQNREVPYNELHSIVKLRDMLVSKRK